MRLSWLVWIAFGCFAAMRESTCVSPIKLETKDGSVFVKCNSEPSVYYELDNGCIAPQGTPTPDDDNRILIGKVGPAVEGTYCCDGNCSSNCDNYSSPEKFIEASEANISLNASASRSFILDIMSYISIGKFSRQELLDVLFEVVASNGTTLDEYLCVIGNSNSCFNDNYSINSSTYELIIFRIDPNHPTFYIRTNFAKYGEDGMKEDFGPTFYITVQPVVTLSIDHASDSFTCSVETSLPATLSVLLNSKPVMTEMEINSTSFNYTNSSRYLPEGEHLLACVVTSNALDGVPLTSSQSKPIIVTSKPTDPPEPSVPSPLPTTTPPPTVETLIIITTATGVIGLVVLVNLVVIIAFIIVFRKRCRPSRDSNA